MEPPLFHYNRDYATNLFAGYSSKTTEKRQNQPQMSQIKTDFNREWTRLRRPTARQAANKSRISKWRGHGGNSGITVPVNTVLCDGAAVHFSFASIRVHSRLVFY